jgi:hypothetical protein
MNTHHSENLYFTDSTLFQDHWLYTFKKPNHENKEATDELL